MKFLILRSMTGMVTAEKYFYCLKNFIAYFGPHCNCYKDFLCYLTVLSELNPIYARVFRSFLNWLYKIYTLLILFNCFRY